MKKCLFFILCAATILYGREISFSELQTSASEHSHRLKLRTIDTSIEQARLEGVYSALYPQLSFGYSGEYNQNLDKASSGSLSVG
jgi:outer membrane protein TolC